MPIFEHIYIKRIENDEHGQEQYIRTNFVSRKEV